MLNPTLIRAAVAGAALALTLTACSSTRTYDDDYSTYEVEDCDVDDMLEGDSDCAGYDDGHSTKKHKATKPKKKASKSSSSTKSTKSTKSGSSGRSSTRRP